MNDVNCLSAKQKAIVKDRAIVINKPSTKKNKLTQVMNFFIDNGADTFFVLKPNSKIRKYKEIEMSKNNEILVEKVWKEDYNIGVETGENLIVLDFDICTKKKPDITRAVADNIEKNNKDLKEKVRDFLLQNTETSISETKHGFHVIYKKPDNTNFIKMTKPFSKMVLGDDFYNAIFQSVDFLTGKNVYFVSPFSTVYDGIDGLFEYKFIREKSLITFGEDNLSREVITLLGEIELQKEIEKGGSGEKEKGNGVRENETSKVLFNTYEIETIGEGSRNETLTSITGFILSYEKDKTRGRELVHQINNTFCKPPLTENEVNSIFNSILKREEKQARNREYYEVKLNENIIEVYFEGNENTTEQEIADLFYERAKGNLFCSDLNIEKQLYLYDNENDIYKTYSVNSFGADFINFYKEIKPNDRYILSQMKREAIYFYVISLANRDCKIIKDYNADPRRYAIFNIIVKVDNQDPVFLGYKSKFKYLSNFQEKDFTIENSEFLKLLFNICKDKNEIDWHKQENDAWENMKYILQYITSAIFNMERDRAETLYLYGAGSNGKTTFINILSNIFEPYIDTLPSEILNPQSKINVEYYLSRLSHARLFFIPEIQEKVNETLLKTITGESLLSVRDPYEPVRTIRNNASLILVSNNLPSIKTFTLGTLRRFLIFPICYQVADKEKDPNLAERIIEKEGDMIFTFFINHAKNTSQISKTNHTIGFDILCRKTKRIIEMTDSYFGELDILGDFIQNCIQKTGNNSDYIPVKEIWERFKTYCETNGIDIKYKYNENKFYQRFNEGKRESKGKIRVRSGIRWL